MREARFILPIRTNDGADLAHVHEALQFELAKTFGGWTAQDVRGGWLAGDGVLFLDNSVAYDIATDSAWRVRDVAMRYGREARQESVYYRDAEGRVEIIDLGSDAQRKAA